MITEQIIHENNTFVPLRTITAADGPVDLFLDTPAGREPGGFGQFINIGDNVLFVAPRQFGYQELHNVVAFANGKEEIINLSTIERIHSYLDRPVDSNIGTFSFADSVPVQTGDWRCDNGRYGPQRFTTTEQVFSNAGQIIVYEKVLSINGIGYLLYVEGHNRTELAEQMVNADEKPITGRTVQETLRLIYEWSTVNADPFSNDENIAVKAAKFISRMKLSAAEIAELDDQTPMQIAKYLSGDSDARRRPSNVKPLSPTMKNIVLSRIGFNSFTALCYANPQFGNWNDWYGFEHAKVSSQIAHGNIMLNNDPDDVRTIRTLEFLNSRLTVLDKVAAGTL